MPRVIEVSPRSAKENYEQFRRLLEAFKPEDFNFILFYGNPTETEISWCPDCRQVHTNFLEMAKKYKGEARFLVVPVGSREEFNEDNPFLRRLPHLEAVPTLTIHNSGILFLKLVDPTLNDITHFMKKYGL